MSKQYFKYGILFLVLIVIAVSGFTLFNRTAVAPTQPNSNKPESEITKPKKPTTSKDTAGVNRFGLVAPTTEFKSRINKKRFGTYVTPANSPVHPERFQGYHTGVDVEFGDVTTDVPIHAITSGKVVYSQWVSGYGGVEIIRHNWESKNHLVLYGHLRPSSMLTVGSQVSQNQQIGLLGTAYSQETDGERRHLHFAILAGSAINLRGYASTKAELANWLDPLSFLP